MVKNSLFIFSRMVYGQKKFRLVFYLFGPLESAYRTSSESPFGRVTFAEVRVTQRSRFYLQILIISYPENLQTKRLKRIKKLKILILIVNWPRLSITTFPSVVEYH